MRDNTMCWIEQDERRECESQKGVSLVLSWKWLITLEIRQTRKQIYQQTGRDRTICWWGQKISLGTKYILDAWSLSRRLLVLMNDCHDSLANYLLYNPPPDRCSFHEWAVFRGDSYQTAPAWRCVNGPKAALGTQLTDTAMFSQRLNPLSSYFYLFFPCTLSCNACLGLGLDLFSNSMRVKCPLFKFFMYV